MEVDNGIDNLQLALPNPAPESGRARESGDDNGGDGMVVDRKSIDGLRQNKLRYVFWDMSEHGFSEHDIGFVRTSLLARGINKWLANRRDFIRLKNDLKVEIRELHERIRGKPKKSLERQRLVGRMEGLVSARERIRQICHSPRWRFPE